MADDVLTKAVREIAGAVFGTNRKPEGCTCTEEYPRKNPHAVGPVPPQHEKSCPWENILVGVHID